MQAGAIVQDRLTDQSIIIGIKEVPLNELDAAPVDGRARTHIMFSHTAKGASISSLHFPPRSHLLSLTLRAIPYPPFFIHTIFHPFGSS